MAETEFYLEVNFVILGLLQAMMVRWCHLLGKAITGYMGRKEFQATVDCFSMKENFDMQLSK